MTKKKIINKEVFNKEIAICKNLFKAGRGKCTWGNCKDCGVVPLLYKLHKGQLLEKPAEIKKVKGIGFNVVHDPQPTYVLRLYSSL